MESLLAKASRLQEAQDWEATAALLAEAIHAGGAPVETFAALARAHRMRGASSDARRVLERGRKEHPGAIPLVKKTYRLAATTRDWQEADSAVAELVEHDPSHAKYHFDRGRVRGWLDDWKGAEDAHIRGLELAHGRALPEIVETIARPLRIIDPTIISEYQGTRGRNSLGSIIHRGENHSFFTKISRWGAQARREKRFFEVDLQSFPQLARVAPAFWDANVEDGVFYLTVEHLPGEAASRRDLCRIIELTETYTGLPYSDVRLMKPKRRSLTLTKSPISVVSLLCEVHSREYNEQIVSMMRNFIASTPEFASITALPGLLEKTILKDELWAFVNPSRDYGLIHCDVTIANALEDRSGYLRIVDWATYTVGPRFLDVLRYAASVFYPVEVLRAKYVLQEDGTRRLTPAQELLFFYAAVLLYVISPSETIPYDDRVREFIQPAMAELKKAHRRFRWDLLRHLSAKERIAWLLGQIFPTIKYAGSARYVSSYARNRSR